jgi:DNA polymerase III alpha subunit
MKTDIYGQPIYSESDLCDLFLVDPNIVLNNVFTERVIDFNPDVVQQVPNLVEYTDPKLSVVEFDEMNQSDWYMPEEYKNFDIAQWVLDQCKSSAELQRAGAELLLFQERNMFILLKYLKYLVDTMRKHNIIWGVGRGSSIASFVLFLIGVHRINSLYYDLDISEFIK